MFISLCDAGGGRYRSTGCGQVLTILPDDIHTMEEAFEYVTTQEEKGCVLYYGFDSLETVKIFEVSSVREIDADWIEHQSELRRKEIERQKSEAELERLKKKLGK